jgi:DNA-binding CsgD family transcriptional regulator
MLRLYHESYREAVPPESSQSPLSTEMENSLEEDGAMPMLRFSLRGKEVFALLLGGLGNKEISERLGMSVSRVKRHRETMLLQNDCNSILKLIAKYYRAEERKDRTNK